jgi:flagellar biosynthesis protein
MARHDDEDEIGPRRARWPRPKEKAPIAVAIDQKPRSGSPQGQSHSPRVVATGRGAVAEQILEIAFAQGVPVREDPDLVELLATLDLDAEIPIDAITAVAEILSYIYRANGQHGTQAGTGGDTPSPGMP